MVVKTTFLSGKLKESIYTMQPNDFIAKGQEHTVCKLHKSIYGLKQEFHLWNKCFDHVVKIFDIDQNKDEPYVYKKVQGSMVVFVI